jgi:hypothetical protein
MLDRSYRWSPEPNWLDAVLRGEQCSVAAMPNCVQIMLSGNIRSGLEAMKINEKGWNERDDGEPYVVRLGRMRALVVSRTAIETAGDDSSWHEAGFAISDVSQGLMAFEVAGAGAFDLMRQMLPIDLRSARNSERGSARMRLDEVSVIAYPHGREDKVRLHVECSHGAYVWQVLAMAIRPVVE